jgi:hypothetical protein
MVTKTHVWLCGVFWLRRGIDAVFLFKSLFSLFISWLEVFKSRCEDFHGQLRRRAVDGCRKQRRGHQSMFCPSVGLSVQPKTSNFKLDAVVWEIVVKRFGGAENESCGGSDINPIFSSESFFFTIYHSATFLRKSTDTDLCVVESRALSACPKAKVVVSDGCVLLAVSLSSFYTRCYVVAGAGHKKNTKAET